jgi:hypothetical protein
MHPGSLRINSVVKYISETLYEQTKLDAYKTLSRDDVVLYNFNTKISRIYPSKCLEFVEDVLPEDDDRVPGSLIPLMNDRALFHTWNSDGGKEYVDGEYVPVIREIKIQSGSHLVFQFTPKFYEMLAFEEKTTPPPVFDGKWKCCEIQDMADYNVRIRLKAFEKKEVCVVVLLVVMTLFFFFFRRMSILSSSLIPS